MKREIGKLWGIRQQEVVPVVVGALGAVGKRLETWLDKLGITIRTGLLQKQLCWEQQGSEGWCWKGEGEGMTQGTFGHWLWLVVLV